MTFQEEASLRRDILKIVCSNPKGGKVAQDNADSHRTSIFSRNADGHAGVSQSHSL